MSRHSMPAPLRCWHVLRVLQSYLDGEADEVTSREVAEHLEECRRCGLEADTYQAIKHALAHHQRPVDDAVTRLHAFAETLARPRDEPETPP